MKPVQLPEAQIPLKMLEVPPCINGPLAYLNLFIALRILIIPVTVTSD